MEISPRRSVQVVAFALIATVATQIIYIVLSDAGMDIHRPVFWTVEGIAYLAISVFALVGLVRAAGPVSVWAAIALGGVLNVIQVGMGVAMFPPLMEAGEAMAAAFKAVLAGAFFLYFAGKFLFGFAAIVAGLFVYGVGSGIKRIVGASTALAGIAALAVNTAAMMSLGDLTFIAGGTGTAATLLLALVLGWATEGARTD